MLEPIPVSPVDSPDEDDCMRASSDIDTAGRERPPQRGASRAAPASPFELPIAGQVGRIHHQTFIDTYAKVGFAKLYTEKTPVRMRPSCATLASNAASRFFIVSRS